MKRSLLAACLAASVPAAWGSGAADPAAFAPRPTYQSVFEGGPAGIVEELLPWKQANEAVAEFPRGHIDLLKWEEAQERASPAGAGTGDTPRAPAAPQARPHAH